MGAESVVATPLALSLQHSKARGPCDRPGLLCIRCVPLASSLDSSSEKMGARCPPGLGVQRTGVSRMRDAKEVIHRIELIVVLVYKDLSAGIWVWCLLTEFIRSTKTRPQAPCPPLRAMMAAP